MKKILTASLLIVCNFCFAQELKYTIANNDWDADSLGNHRVILDVNAKGSNIVKAVIEWRRNDFHPDEKQLFVVDAATNKRIYNVKTENISRESGTIYFEPSEGTRYYVYYMPYKVNRKSNYPNAKYLKPEQTASAEWLKALENDKNIPLAKVESIQAVNAMNSFYPMEVIATASELKALEAKYPSKQYLVFVEDRMHPIKMKYDLPQRWIVNGLKNSFNGEAEKGENFAYQLGIYPVAHNLDNVKVTFSDLKNDEGEIISSKNMSCLNNGGIDYKGQPFTERVDVPKGQVQAMWCLVNVPKNAAAGTYSGYATVTAKDMRSTPIKIALNVSNKAAKNGGVNEPKKMTRLVWLNSTMAQKNDVIKPYTPLKVDGQNISLLGRKVILDKTGFPAKIETFFTPEMTGMTGRPKEVINQPISFMLETTDDKKVLWQPAGMRFTEKKPGTVKWTAQNSVPGLKMDVSGSIEFDGFVAYTVKVTALRDISFNDLRLHIPYNIQSARYMMGLNLKGEKRPSSYEWKWDVANKNQDGAWIGDVNAGMQFSLRDEHYVRPLNTNFYLQRPLVLPTSWGNDNKGGIRITEANSTVWVNNYSGPRTMKKGDVLYYNFNLLITPFHAINTDFQWATRFYHKYADLDSIKATGATVVNIHHGTPINPYINYPFIAHDAMKAYIDKAHQLGLKVKIYNTIRELSNSAYELYPLRSLGHEVFSAGKGGGYSWLQEHLGDDYIAAWYMPEYKDAAIINSGMNRWHNYYVEGMNWLVQNVGIDGIYLDDVAFDRVTMKRIKRVLTADGHPGIIDLHSANQYDKADGFNNSANLYMENFPYLNRLWFGEYFDYEHNSPDFFLTEVSGIPFGLMGEMLQGGGNPWRGMVYGMTNRMPWSDNADPRPIWKVWDDFGMRGSEMIGYWVASSPVKTDNPSVLATIYKKEKSTLVAIGSWAESDVNTRLNIDWKALGIDPANATITAPEVKNFQPAAEFKPGQDIPVSKGKGWMLIIKEK
ncbi:MAG: hypothetical protein JST19_16520 [Bacteroidetes bacterium]|nr:hypothetical protein [Bacteroidota bacterium]